MSGHMEYNKPINMTFLMVSVPLSRQFEVFLLNHTSLKSVKVRLLFLQFDFNHV